MTKSRVLTRKFIIIALVIVIMLLHITSVLPRAIAIASSTLYVTIKYSDKKFKYESIEFVPSFGDYFVSFKDRNGEVISFTITPKLFPVYILYDPLDRPMKD